MMTTFQGRIAVVTGSNKGIGYFIALQLGLSGLFQHVLLACRDTNRANEAAAAIQAQVPASVKISSLPLTLGDAASHSAFCQKMQETFDFSLIFQTLVIKFS